MAAIAEEQQRPGDADIAAYNNEKEKRAATVTIESDPKNGHKSDSGGFQEGIHYVIGVIIANITSLKNHIIFIGFSNTPRITTAFTGPAIKKLFYKQVNFRWAFGAFTIILIASCIPAIGLMMVMFHKARQAGILEKRPPSGRTFLQSIKFYIIEFNLIGIFVLIFALSFLLLPFSLNTYFNSYLQVVHRQDITTSSCILNTFILTTAFFTPVIGFLISYTSDFKWTAYTGVPIMLLGTALLIPFRSPNAPISMLVFTQFLIGLGSEIFSAYSTLAIMAPVTHQYITAVSAIGSLFGGVGASIGIAIAGAMWNNMIPDQLRQRLPEELKANATTIYGDMRIQMAFEDGTPGRDAVVGAYARLMVIVGAAFMRLCLLCVFSWKYINVRKIEEEQGKQTKGMIV
ncbi:hypothetical protein NLG97_g8398 [Lecanicillium saksenae]|uniref:Uncharacterized protein n=1 Tax=Lecanicillium saksenae TaxID=468837 RepID=A0ACC1QM27_9HYPO|nr:hypothetical protein NLG97_g8398 [Lecanicillium saksenae]